VIIKEEKVVKGIPVAACRAVLPVVAPLCVPDMLDSQSSNRL